MGSPVDVELRHAAHGYPRGVDVVVFGDLARHPVGPGHDQVRLRAPVAPLLVGLSQATIKAAVDTPSFAASRSITASGRNHPGLVGDDERRAIAAERVLMKPGAIKPSFHGEERLAERRGAHSRRRIRSSPEATARCDRATPRRARCGSAPATFGPLDLRRGCSGAGRQASSRRPGGCSGGAKLLDGDAALAQFSPDVALVGVGHECHGADTGRQQRLRDARSQQVARGSALRDHEEHVAMCGRDVWHGPNRGKAGADGDRFVSGYTRPDGLREAPEAASLPVPARCHAPLSSRRYGHSSFG